LPSNIYNTDKLCCVIRVSLKTTRHEIVKYSIHSSHRTPLVAILDSQYRENVTYSIGMGMPCNYDFFPWSITIRAL